MYLDRSRGPSALLLMARCVAGAAQFRYWTYTAARSSAPKFTRRTWCASTALAERIATIDNQPVLHGQNGYILKATTVLAMPQWLGVMPSSSRARVADASA